MHELALMESLVTTVRERVVDRRVTRVWLEVGRLSCAAPDALRFCFEVCAADTPLEGATLEVVEVPGRARCRACGQEGVLELAHAPCGCGSFDLEVLAGEELRLEGVEVI
jgi:hydrogenase nickel incorporation protein HypA/HybF